MAVLLGVAKLDPGDKPQVVIVVAEVVPVALVIEVLLEVLLLVELLAIVVVLVEPLAEHALTERCNVNKWHNKIRRVMRNLLTCTPFTIRFVGWGRRCVEFRLQYIQYINIYRTTLNVENVCRTCQMYSPYETREPL
jgi:hypothetical protein